MCIVKSANSHDELMEAEDLLIRYVSNNDTIAGIPRMSLLGKVYKLLGRTKLMHHVCSERINMATSDEDRAYTLAGAVYASITGTDTYHYAKDALPLLRAMGNRSEAMAIVLEALSKSVQYLTPQERLAYAEELLALLKELPSHPMLPTQTETYLLLSHIYIEQAKWHEALQYAILAVDSATADVNDGSNQEVASICRLMVRLYEMMNEPREAIVTRFKALKMEVLFCSDLLLYAEEFHKVADELAQIREYRLATSAQLLSLRCLIDSDEPTYNQIRESVILLQNYERNST